MFRNGVGFFIKKTVFALTNPLFFRIYYKAQEPYAFEQWEIKVKTVKCFLPCVLGFAGVLSAESISVNFSGGGTAGFVVEGSGEVGLEPVPGNRWNNFSGNNGKTPQPVTDSLGAATTARITYMAPGVYTSSGSAPALLRGYLDDRNANDVPSISITGVPYAAYDLIVYFATDTADIKFGSPLINGTYYACEDDGIGFPVAYGAVSWGDSSVKTAPEWGKNAIRINGLSSAVYPTLQIVGGYVPAATGVTRGRATIAGFQIVETQAPVVTAPQALNFTFTHEADSALTAPQGVVAAPETGWHSPATLGAASGTQPLPTLSDGMTSSATITWSASGSASNTAAPAGSLLRGYLDDGAPGAAVSFAGIPFSSYDAYIILSSDAVNTAGAMRPVSVNGAAYTFNGYKTIAGSADFAFPQGAFDASPIEGKNYLVVRDLSGPTLAIQGLAVADGARGSIAAVQIVNRGLALANTLTRTLTANADWHANAWSDGSGGTNLPWQPGANAVVTAGSFTLTLTEPAVANTLVINGVGSIMPDTPKQFVAGIRGTLLASSAPENVLEVASIDINPTTSTSNNYQPTITASLKGKDGGELKLYAHGQTGPLSNSGLTNFKPQTLVASAVRVYRGILNVAATDARGVPLLLDGGGLVDLSGGVTFDQPVQIGSTRSIYRTYNPPSPAVFAGSLSNEQGLTQAGMFSHIDTAALIIAGDISRFNGPLVNEGGDLIFTNTVRSASGNVISFVSKRIVYDVPAGESAVYKGVFAGVSPSTSFIKRGGGTLTLEGKSTTLGGTLSGVQARPVLQIEGGTLVMGANGFGGLNDQTAGEKLAIINGGTLVLKADWNHGANFAFGLLGHHAKMNVNGGTIRFETDSTTVQGGGGSNNGRGFHIFANGATLEVAAPYTYTKRRTGGGYPTGESIWFEEANAKLTLAGTGAGILHEDIPTKGPGGALQGRMDGRVEITGSNWTLNGEYTYTGGTTVAAGGVLKGTGSFTGSPVTVAGTIETGAAIGTLNLGAGSTVRIVSGKVLNVSQSATVAETVKVSIAAVPAGNELVPFMTLPEGVKLADFSAFAVEGVEGAEKCRVTQIGRNVGVISSMGICVTLF